MNLCVSKNIIKEGKYFNHFSILKPSISIILYPIKRD